MPTNHVINPRMGLYWFGFARPAGISPTRLTIGDFFGGAVSLCDRFFGGDDMVCGRDDRICGRDGRSPGNQRSGLKRRAVLILLP